MKKKRNDKKNRRRAESAIILRHARARDTRHVFTRACIYYILHTWDARTGRYTRDEESDVRALHPTVFPSVRAAKILKGNMKLLKYFAKGNVEEE